MPSLAELVLVLVTAALVAPFTVSVLAATSSASSGPGDATAEQQTDAAAPPAPVAQRPQLATAGLAQLRLSRPATEATATEGTATEGTATVGDRATGGDGATGHVVDDGDVGIDIAAQAARDRQRAPDRGGSVEPVPVPAPMAAAGDLQLVVPADPDDEAVIGFHQAGPGSAAVPLEPRGRTVDSHVPSFEEVEEDEEDGHDHAVMATRKRGTAFTSAVDIALPEGAAVLAPVDGVVTTVAPYALYGRYTDVVVAITPTDDPDVVVHLFHVEDPQVAEGDEVRAGQTPLAGVRSLSVPSQIDRFTGDERPHVHLEVRTRSG